MARPKSVPSPEANAPDAAPVPEWVPVSEAFFPLPIRMGVKMETSLRTRIGVNEHKGLKMSHLDYRVLKIEADCLAKPKLVPFANVTSFEEA